MRKVWEALEPNGDGVVSGWAIQTEQRAKLDQKIDMLSAADVNLQTAPTETFCWTFEDEPKGPSSSTVF